MSVVLFFQYMCNLLIVAYILTNIIGFKINFILKSMVRYYIMCPLTAYQSENISLIS